MTATTATTTATTDLTIIKQRAPMAAVRLALTPAGSAPGLLDGAWWPRSRDLLRELPSLAAELDPIWGRITHATVNPTYWPVIPHKVPAAGHTVHVGWFAAEQDPHQVTLHSYTEGRWDLLVVPPETDPATAARLMAAASAPGGVRSPTRLMADGGAGDIPRPGPEALTAASGR